MSLLNHQSQISSGFIKHHLFYVVLAFPFWENETIIYYEKKSVVFRRGWLECSVHSLFWHFTGSYQYNVPESLPVASVVARIKAIDADIGVNAEMEYKIVDGDGLEIFKITADKETQEGIITIQKVMFPLLFLFHKGDVMNSQTTRSALKQRCYTHIKCHTDILLF